MNSKTEDIAAALADARAEIQRLRKAIESILPGMKCQQPPKLGAWNWPHAVKTLEEALNPTKP